MYAEGSIARLNDCGKKETLFYHVIDLINITCRLTLPTHVTK